MPRVPTVTGPSVAEQPLTGGFDRSNPQPIIDRQRGAAALALTEVGTRIQERQDADLIMRAETEIKGKYLEWEGEAKQRKGQQAWGVAKEAAAWWDEHASRVSATLENPIQKGIFAQSVARLRGHSVGLFSGHEAGERRASLVESAQASVVGSINLAAANPNNVELITSTKQDVVKRTAVLAELNGWGPEVRDAKQAEYLTNLHKQVIQGLARDNPLAAREYFEANKAEIEGSQHAEIGEFARKATATKRAEDAADAVWQAAGPKSDRDPVTLDVMEKQIREQFKADPDTAKIAIAGLRERAQAFKDSRRERDDQLEASVNQAIMDGASPRDIRRMPQFLQLSPESARKIADFMDNRSLRAEQRAAARESRAASAETRQQTALTRRGMGAYLAYSNPDTLHGMTEAQVLNLLPDLGNELTSHLMTQKRALAKPGRLGEAKMDQEDFNHVARQMKLPVDDTRTPEAKASLGELKYRVEQVIEAVQQRAGKPISRGEKLEIMRSEMARTVTVDPGLFSSNRDVPVIALTGEEAARVVIPPADRKDLTEAMRVMYERTKSPLYAPTPDNLKRFYLQKKSPTAGMILPAQ
jgi:tetrahydromethanopterin S-methyltransferase subunit G